MRVHITSQIGIRVRNKDWLTPERFDVIPSGMPDNFAPCFEDNSSSLESLPSIAEVPSSMALTISLPLSSLFSPLPPFPFCEPSLGARRRLYSMGSRRNMRRYRGTYMCQYTGSFSASRDTLWQYSVASPAGIPVHTGS